VGKTGTRSLYVKDGPPPVVGEAQHQRDDIDVERLSAYLKALAHPNRLELLWLLRIPTAAADLHLRPRRRDDVLSAERAISRQAVLQHLESLEEVGVVDRLPDEPGAPQRRVLNQARLFALIEDLRALTLIRPAVRVDVDATLPQPRDAQPAWPAGPKLVLASGPWEGHTFPLGGPGPWSVGRSRSQDVSLAYDPYVSAEHARIVRGEGGALAVEPAPGARNPCQVNFAPLSKGEARVLRPGDVVGVGRSALVFQPA
jgi:DNA-binding transcriptional ArsR family regulator